MGGVPKALHRSTLTSYLAETKTMVRQLSYGGHQGAVEAARVLVRELEKELERLDPKPRAPYRRG
jgi:hypothetical protein